MPDAVPEVVLAVVRKVCAEGDRRYVVTNPLEPTPSFSTEESITFSLAYWRGDQVPQKQQIVRLLDVSRFRQGWRALSAEPIRN